MKISVVVPTRNSQATLGPCLDAIFANSHPPSEVFVVDCGSTDESYRRIVARYPVTLLETNGEGKGSGRNLGIRAAGGDVIVLLDADVVIPPDAFARVVARFRERPDVDVINGLLAKSGPHDDFFSEYKNLYMNYRFRKMPEEIDFLFTSFTAFRKETGVQFRDAIKPKDTESGQQMAKEEGRKILFDRDLEVVHWKRYTFWKLLYNDFIVPYGWAKIFWRFRGPRDIARKGRFAHSTLDQLLSIALTGLAVIGLVGAWLHWPLIILKGVAVAGFVMVNIGFFRFLGRHKGWRFMVQGASFTFLDNLVMGTAVAWGFLETAAGALLRRLRAGWRGLRYLYGTPR